MEGAACKTHCSSDLLKIPFPRSLQKQPCYSSWRGCRGQVSCTPFSCVAVCYFFFSWASSCSCEKIAQWVRVLWRRQRERTSESYSKGVVRAEGSLRRGQSPEPKRRACVCVGFDRSKGLGLECCVQVLAVSGVIEDLSKSSASSVLLVCSGCQQGLFVLLVFFKKTPNTSFPGYWGKNVIFYPGAFGVH